MEERKGKSEMAALAHRLVRHDEGDGAVERHGVVELVLEHVQIEQPVWVRIGSAVATAHAEGRASG